MQLHLFAKGTKLKLSQPWEVNFHPEGSRLYNHNSGDYKILEKVVRAKGTILSLHDIDIRGGGRTPKSVKFFICKGGCPTKPEYESQCFHVTLNEAANADFEFSSRGDAKLNDLESAYLQIEKEIK